MKASTRGMVSYGPYPGWGCPDIPLVVASKSYHARIQKSKGITDRMILDTIKKLDKEKKDRICGCDSEPMHTVGYCEAMGLAEKSKNS
jgi:hypothetical protein